MPYASPGRRRERAAVCIPGAWVPEESVRLALPRRLAGLHDAAILAEFGAELANRFGKLLAEATALLAHGWLRLVAEARDIVTYKIGPKAVGLTLREDFEASLVRLAASAGGKRMKDRIILDTNEASLICVLEEYLPI